MVNGMNFEKEIDALRGKIKDLEERRRVIDEELEPAKKELSHWEAIASLRRDSSLSQTMIEITPETMQNSPLFENGVAGELVEEYGGKSEAIFNFISSYSGWFTPPTIHNAMISKGFSISANYIYKVLANLEQDGLVERNGRRYRSIASAEGGSATA
jgi:hypothetical protein